MMSFKQMLAPISTLVAITAGTVHAAAPPDHHSAMPNLPSWVASYFGGSGLGTKEQISDMVIDPVTQDIIVVGQTNSPDAPITAGAADTFFAGGSEGFVARFSTDLGTLHAATYFGGDGEDEVYNVTLDPANGDVLIVGFTKSSSLPGITGAPQSIPGGGYDSFVARLSANLSQVKQSTYLGRSGDEYGIGIKVRESDGNVFIVGSSGSGTLPGSAAGAQPTNAGGNLDGFVARFSSDLKTLGATSFQGGSGYDDLYDLWIDPATGDVVVGGITGSLSLGNIAGAAQSQNAGGLDVQLARFSSNLGTRYRSTFYGGGQNEYFYRMTFDPATGGLLIAGSTRSPALPGAVGTAQSELHGSQDGFVVRFATDLGARGRATYLGGEGDDFIYALIVAADGQIVVTGESISPHFPGASAASSNGVYAFVSRVASNMLGNFSSLVIRGSGDKTTGLALARSGLSRVCMSGYINRAGLPYTADGAQPDFGGGPTDGFVTCLKDDQFPIFVDGFD